jgi:hypothetical protein
MAEILPATTQGKEHALKKLAERRAHNRERPLIDNSSFPAGAPMFFPCLACGGTIAVPESYLSKPDLCPECQALKTLGWLE